MENVSISKFCNDKLTMVVIGNNVLWFSYQTLVAFEIDGKTTICENVWSTTTGKHLNFINSDKSIRIARKDFTEQTKHLNFSLDDR